MLFPTLGAHERGALDILTADHTIGIFYVLAAITFDLFNSHAKSFNRTGIYFAYLAFDELKRSIQH
jgi:hypothetical protein